MIDLSKCSAASPLVHTVDSDPGTRWSKDAAVAIDAPPDSDTHPRPEATWSHEDRRTGLCGVVSPRVLALPSGGYRMYYSQMLPPGFPAGANDYDNASTRILSAFSHDGRTGFPNRESGFRRRKVARAIFAWCRRRSFRLVMDACCECTSSAARVLRR